ncbi:MAG: response regulator [Dehalococcoidia bacterium]
MPQVEPRNPSVALQGTVLVIDDDDIVRTVIGRMLERAGFHVLTAEDGLAGIAAFREHLTTVQAVILDMTMPRMDGVETCRSLRELSPGVKVILSSGYAQRDAVVQLPALAVAGYLQKPYAADELLALLHSVIATAV